MTNIKLNNFEKVVLPGETPWAIVIEWIGDRRFIGEINNRVSGDYTPEEFHDLLGNIFNAVDDVAFDGIDKRKHTHKLGDVLEFVWCEKTGGYIPAKRNHDND